MPYKSKALHYNRSMTYYTPANNKFDGYMQFAKPRSQPYVNRKQMIKLNTKKRKFAKSLKETMSGTLSNKLNQGVFTR